MKAAYLIITVALLAACTSGEKHSANSDHEHTSHEDVVQYTCPMHPQVVQDHPGTCPICGMDLVPASTSHPTSQSLMLSETQIRLGNITTIRATGQPVGETTVVNGMLTANQDKTEVISSRAPGRIEKLFIKETGQPVRKGEPLYQLYSEVLMTLQAEYLLAKAQYEQLGSTSTRYASFMKSAREKLLRYGLTSSQIASLDKQPTPQSRVTLLSPSSGVITSVKVLEGQYVDEGEAIYEAEDIGTLWVEAELYPYESALVKTGDEVLIRVPGLASKSFEAAISFVSPEYRKGSQVTVVRAEIPNHDLLLKPGQRAEITFTHSSREGIAVPPDAIIRDGEGSHVYVRSGEHTFLRRSVETGVSGVGSVEITSGINEGDDVVLTGAYLLYAELTLKGSTHAH